MKRLMVKKCQWQTNSKLCVNNPKDVTKGVDVGVLYGKIKNALSDDTTIYDSKLGQTIQLKCPVPKKLKPIRILIVGSTVQGMSFSFV